MKYLLALTFFLAAPALQSSQEWKIEYGITVWESTMVSRIGVNRAYAQMFPPDSAARAYFNGKADSYAELLDELNSTLEEK